MNKTRKWDPDVRKREILNCAIKVLNKKVYYKCPVDEIARYAGIAKGTIYIYFKNKEDLYLSVIFNLIDKFIEIIENVCKMDISASKQLSILLRQMNIFLRTHRHLFLSIREESKPPKGKFHEAFHARFHKITQAIGHIIEKGIKDGEFKKFPPYVVGSIILSVSSLFAHKEFSDNTCGRDIDSGLVLKILMNGLAK
jgi:AcrR family transcriptional regulator